MKTLPTLAASLVFFFFSIHCEAQIPNPGFEDWSDDSPIGWNINSDLDLEPVYQSDQAYQGLYSLGLGVDSDKFGSLGGLAISQLFPYTTIENALDGWCKPNFEGDDVLVATSSLLQEDEFTVALGAITESLSSDQWVNFTIPMTQTSNEVVFFGTITFEIFNDDGSPNPDTEVLIDDLSFSSDTQIEEFHAVDQTTIERIFPNPASEIAMLQYSIPRASDVQISVIDLNGVQVQQVYSAHVPLGRYRAEIPVDNLASGVYLVKLHDGSSTLISKLIVGHH